MKVYVINLRHQVERRNFMHSGLSACGFSDDDILWIDAVNAAELLDLPKQYTPHLKSKSYWELTQTEIACFESHRLAWRLAALNQETPSIIMEDDVILTPNFISAVKEIIASQPKFSAIKLDYSPGLRCFSSSTTLSCNQLLTVKDSLPSAACYILSGNGAEILLNASTEYCDHLDEFVWTPREGYYVFQLRKSLAIQGMFCGHAKLEVSLPSWIKNSLRTEQDKPLPSVNRGPASYRLKKEANRLRRKVKAYLSRNSPQILITEIDPPDICGIH